MNFTSKYTAIAVLSVTLAFSGNFSAQNMKEKTVMVGGGRNVSFKNIVENAVNSKDHTTLVAAVKVAGLVETLQGKGPLPYCGFLLPTPLLENFRNLQSTIY